MAGTDSAAKLGLIRAGSIVFLLGLMLFILLVTPFKLGVPLILGIALLSFSIVHIHARRTTYICKNCSKPFKISAWMDFTTPNAVSTKFLPCPHCGETAWHRAE